MEGCLIDFTTFERYLISQNGKTISIISSPASNRERKTDATLEVFKFSSNSESYYISDDRLADAVSYRYCIPKIEIEHIKFNDFSNQIEILFTDSDTFKINLEIEVVH